MTRRAAQNAGAGLPGASAESDRLLREAGIDPDRLSITFLGYRFPNWMLRMGIGYALWIALFLLNLSNFAMPGWALAFFSLVTGLVVLQAACQVLVMATELTASRMRWTHYVAGSMAEMLATLPECIVIGFVVTVSPQVAFTIALITIYNNALVFSIYSYFLPKDRYGKFVMPTAVTNAGTQLLIAGGVLGLVLGLVMLLFMAGNHEKQAFAPVDLATVALLLLFIFAVYMQKLITGFVSEEEEIHSVLDLTEGDKEQRVSLVYQHVKNDTWPRISIMFALGVIGAFLGGESVAQFAEVSISQLGLSGILAAIILTVFAGMSEYVILWTSHRKKEYGIALANAFGGITQLMFLIVPFTLASIAFFHEFVEPGHADLPIPFSITNIMLLIFLFPTMHTLAALLENDHTMGVLDTTIMISIVALLLLLLVAYGEA